MNCSLITHVMLLVAGCHLLGIGRTAIAAEPRHWSFRTIVQPPVPPTSASDWPQSPIDAFVLDRLRHESLAPSAAASRITLLRRVTLDLTGLPPTPEEVADFQRHEQPDDYERRVDRLLASPHYA